MAPVLAAPPPQEPSGQITGTLVDPTGAAVSEALVTASGGGISREAAVDGAGRYSISGLQAGTYMVSIRSPGFKARQIAGIAVGEGRSVALNVTLNPANAETISVSASAPTSKRRGPPGGLMMSAAPPEAPSMAQQVTEWINGLPSGSVKYFVKDKMTLNVPSTATATIYPPGVAPPAEAGAAAQGNAAARAGGGAVTPEQAEVPHELKVATYMRVDLTQEDNPGTFKIDPALGVCKLILTDRPTEWDFQVTPLQGGSGKKLRFTAYAVYGAEASSCAPDNPASIPLPVDKETVNVAEFNVRNAWQTTWDTFWSSPWKWLLSILPGGAAFARLGTMMEWWKKRKKPGGTPAAGPGSDA